MQFNTETVNKILDIDDSYKAPEALMKIMMNPSKREIVFDEFLAVSSDLSFDWFHEYYEDEQSQRKSKSKTLLQKEWPNLWLCLLNQVKLTLKLLQELVEL